MIELRLAVDVTVSASPALLAAVTELAKALAGMGALTLPQPPQVIPPPVVLAVDPAPDPDLTAAPEAPVAPAPAEPIQSSPAAALIEQAKAPSPGRVSWRTAERAEILRREWPKGTANTDIRAMMECCDGLPIPHNFADLVSVWAGKFGLRRPEGSRSPPMPRPSQPPAKPVRFAHERPSAAIVVPPPALPPALPAHPETVEMTFDQLKKYASAFGIPYDGRQVDQVNKIRARSNLPPVVQIG